MLSRVPLIESEYNDLNVIHFNSLPADMKIHINVNKSLQVQVVVFFLKSHPDSLKCSLDS